jgi:hypothetical protein
MDLCAALTLHVSRFVQMPVDPPASPTRWTFVPEGRRATWDEAAALLASAPKPLMVAPLLEPGALGSWGVRALAGDDLRRAQHELANQLAGLKHLLDQLGISDDAEVLFETPGDQLSLPVSELQRWFTEYLVFVGWTLGSGPDPDRSVRLLVRRSDGAWSPGTTCSVPRAAT